MTDTIDYNATRAKLRELIRGMTYPDHWINREMVPGLLCDADTAINRLADLAACIVRKPD